MNYLKINPAVVKAIMKNSNRNDLKKIGIEIKNELLKRDDLNENQRKCLFRLLLFARFLWNK